MKVDSSTEGLARASARTLRAEGKPPRREKDTAGLGDSGQMSNDHAGVIVLPPLAIVPTLVAGLLLHFLWTPLSLLPEWWIGHAVGWPLVVAGVLLSRWSKRTMFRAGVDPNPYEPTTAIATTGPYALSRNPIYVSATVVYVGIAFVVNMAWLIVCLPFGITLLYYGVIAREESYMEKVFGGEYRQYKARVRRWV